VVQLKAVARMTLKSSKADKAFMFDCIQAGGAIRELAAFAINKGWSPRRFRVMCEYAVLKDLIDE